MVNKTYLLPFLYLMPPFMGQACTDWEEHWVCLLSVNFPQEISFL